MNPTRAMVGQAAMLVVTMTLLALTNETIPLLLVWAIAAVQLVNAIWLVRSYVTSLRRAGRPRSHRRRRGDRFVTVELALCIVVPVGASVAEVTGVVAPLPSDLAITEAVTVVFALAVVSAAIFGSSLVDWLRILPARDGLVCLPPCMDAARDRWIAPTKLWYIHRLVAEVVWFGVLVSGSIALLFELAERTTGPLALGLKVVGPVLSIIALVYSLSKPKIKNGSEAARATPRFLLGDTIQWRRSEETTEVRFLGFYRRKVVSTDAHSHYVLAVALDFVEVLDADALAGSPTSQVPAAEHVALAPLLRSDTSLSRRRDVPCRTGCRRLHPNCERQLDHQVSLSAAIPAPAADAAAAMLVTDHTVSVRYRVDATSLPEPATCVLSFEQPESLRVDFTLDLPEPMRHHVLTNGGVFEVLAPSEHADRRGDHVAQRNSSRRFVVGLKTIAVDCTARDVTWHLDSDTA
jgi:hypothetical protein